MLVCTCTAQARFGSVCERLFGTTNTQFIHNLRGNTQITRNVRQVTKSVSPQGQAVWTLGALEERLSEYLLEIYGTVVHPALSLSPREAFTAGMESSGLRVQRTIPYDEDFLMATLPTTTKGVAMVLPGRGVKVNQIYYWSDRFRNPAVEGTCVAVRYDPFDVGAAYAFVERQWVRCYSEHHLIFQGRSEKAILLASHELRRRNQVCAGEKARQHESWQTSCKPWRAKSCCWNNECGTERASRRAGHRSTLHPIGLIAAAPRYRRLQAHARGLRYPASCMENSE